MRLCDAEQHVDGADPRGDKERPGGTHGEAEAEKERDEGKEGGTLKARAVIDMKVILQVYDERDEKVKKVRAAADISGSTSAELSRLIDLLGAGCWLATHQRAESQ